MSQPQPGTGLVPEGAQPPDAELVRRVLDGETEAFGVLLTRYRAQFGRYATSLCGDRDVAADAMQDAFIRAYDALGSCNDPARFGSWFFRILTNQCHSHRARQRRHLQLETVDPPALEQTDDAVAADEVRHAVHDAVSALSPMLREAFVLKHLDGRSYHEMAELLDTDEATLRQRAHRARELVKQRLEHVR